MFREGRMITVAYSLLCRLADYVYFPAPYPQLDLLNRLGLPYSQTHGGFAGYGADISWLG